MPSKYDKILKFFLPLQQDEHVSIKVKRYSIGLLNTTFKCLRMGAQIDYKDSVLKLSKRADSCQISITPTDEYRRLQLIYELIRVGIAVDHQHTHNKCNCS